MSVPQVAEGALLTLTRQAREVSLDELSPPGGLMLVIPHPDDETLGCGMALSAAAQAGRDLMLVLLTDGEGSHPRSPSTRPERLAAIRRDELAEALTQLVGERPVLIERLSLPDGSSTADMLDPERLDALEQRGRDLRVRSIWTTWRHDPHCDHQAAAAIAASLARRLEAVLWEFPVWGRFGALSHPVPELTRFEPGDPDLALRKRRAMAAHRSQMTRLIRDDSYAFVMPAALAEHFDVWPELFIRG